MEVRELGAASRCPLILDCQNQNCRPETRRRPLAHYVFAELRGVDAITLSPSAGFRTSGGALSALPGGGVSWSPAHSSNAASEIVQHHPDEDDPLYLKVRVRRVANLGHKVNSLLLRWAPSNSAGTGPGCGRDAPERFVILRSLGERRSVWSRCSRQGLTSSPDGWLACHLPQNLLVEKDIEQGTAGSAPTDRNDALPASMWAAADRCSICVTGTGRRPANKGADARPSRSD